MGVDGDTYQEFLEDFGYYNIFESVLLSSGLNIWLLKLDMQYNDFSVLDDFSDDYRVISCQFNEYLDFIECPRPTVSINDISVNTLINISVYPNPVINKERIIFSIQPDPNLTEKYPYNYTSEIKKAEMNIYNIKGQLVKKTTDMQIVNGKNSFDWDKKDNKNLDVASGVYFYRILLDNNIFSGKILILN
jgi:hypothetical protein